MKFYLLLPLFVLPLCLLAEMTSQAEDSFAQASSLPLAPLIPLEPQFPLQLTQANQQLLSDPQQLEKIKHSIQSELEQHSFPWLTLIMLLGSGGIGWAIYLTRDRWPKRLTKPKPSLSSKQQIDQKLQALRNTPPQSENIQTYYAKLSSILLEALHLRLGWQTQSLTTAELTQTLRKQSQLPIPLIEKALTFLMEMDLVKFAGKKVTPNETIEMTQQIQHFVVQLFG
jgi:hypothetical protein